MHKTTNIVRNSSSTTHTERIIGIYALGFSESSCFLEKSLMFEILRLRQRADGMRRKGKLIQKMVPNNDETS